jgi:integrase
VARATRYRNRWRIRPIDHTGLRLCRTFDTAGEAEAWAADVECGKRLIVEGRLEYAEEARTFEDLADHWEQHHLPSLRSQTAAKSVLKYLKRYFDKVILSDINQRLVDQFIAWLHEQPMKGRRRGQRRKPATIRNYVTQLIAMLNLAVDLAWLEHSPRIRKPRLVEQPFKAIDRIEDVKKVLRAAEGQRAEAAPLYAVALLAGLRQGEIAGLRWDEVDFERRLITVARSWDQPATKSGRIRRVPILDPLLPILQEWKARSDGTGPVFSNGWGGPLIRSNRIFREVWHETLRQAGLPEMRFHDARHSFASLWVQASGDLYKLQAILGHQSTQMTQRYAHLRPEVFRGEWGRLGGELDLDEGDEP